MLRIIDLISDNQWDRVKTLWILDVNGMKPNDEWQFSTFGSEYVYLIRHFLPFQEVFFFCTKCKIEVRRPLQEFYLAKDDKG